MMQNLLFIRGSEGKLDYMAFARKGSILLALKCNAVMPGDKLGMKDTLYVGAKVRSTEIESGVELHSEKVQNIAFAKLTPDNAWPAITWEKHSAIRGLRYASTQVAVFEPGDVRKNPEMLDDLLIDQKLAHKWVDYLAVLADGEENFLFPREALVEWFQGFYEKTFGALKEAMQLTDNYKKEMKENVGLFGMQAALLKKAYDKSKTKDVVDGIVEEEGEEFFEDEEEDEEEDDEDEE